MEKFFLVLIIFFTLYIAYSYILPSILRRWGYSLIGLTLTSFLLIVLLDVFTLKPRLSGAFSGNGNLGLLVLIPLAPVLAAFLIVWGKGTYRGFAQKKSTFLNRWLAGSLIGLSIAILLQVQFALRKLEQLEGQPHHPFTGTSILNQYTNTLFINGYTFGSLTLIVFIGMLLLVKRKSGSKTL